MPVKTHIITGPDIDRLADGIHRPELAALQSRVKNLTGQHKALKVQAKALRKELRAMTNARDSLLQDLAASRETKLRLVRANAALKTQLLNHHITPLDQEEAA